MQLAQWSLYFARKLNLVLILTKMYPSSKFKTPFLLTTEDNNETDPFLLVLSDKIRSISKKLSEIRVLAYWPSLNAEQLERLKLAGPLLEEKKKYEEMVSLYNETREENKRYYEEKSNKDLQSLVTAMVMFAANNKDINIANRFKNYQIFNKYLFPGDLYKIWKRLNQPTGFTINSTIADITNFIKKKMANKFYQREVELFLEENGDKKFYNHTGHYYMAYQYSWMYFDDDKNDQLGVFRDHYIYPNYAVVDEEGYYSMKQFDQVDKFQSAPVVPSVPKATNQNNQVNFEISQDNLQKHHEEKIAPVDLNAEIVQLNQQPQVEQLKSQVIELKVEDVHFEKEQKELINELELAGKCEENISKDQPSILLEEQKGKEEQLTMKEELPLQKAEQNIKQTELEPQISKELIMSLVHQPANAILEDIPQANLREESKTESKELKKESKGNVIIEIEEVSKCNIQALEHEGFRNSSLPLEHKTDEVSLSNLEHDLKSEVSESSTYQQLASETTIEVKNQQESQFDLEVPLENKQREDMLSLPSQSNLKKSQNYKEERSNNQGTNQNDHNRLQNSREKKDSHFERDSHLRFKPEKKKYRPKYETKEEIKQRADSSSSSSTEIRGFRKEEIRQLEEEGFILVSKAKPKPQGIYRGGNRSKKCRQLYQA